MSEKFSKVFQNMPEIGSEFTAYTDGFSAYKRYKITEIQNIQALPDGAYQVDGRAIVLTVNGRPIGG